MIQNVLHVPAPSADRVRGRSVAAPRRLGLFLALVLCSCSSPDAAAALAFPICADASGAIVIEEPPDAGRMVSGHSGTGERAWRASLGQDAYPAAVGQCAVAVLSSSVRSWPYPERVDPPAVVYSRAGAVTWPGQEGFTKYRVLAATAFGEGVVAVGRGANISVLLQSGGEYVHTMEMASDEVDWVQAPAGTVGMAFDYLAPRGYLAFYEQTGDRWRFVRSIDTPAPVVQAYVVTPERYLIRTDSEFLLYENGHEVTVAPTDFYSDAYLTDRYIVLVSRRVEGEGVARSDVRVLDNRLQSVYTKSFADNVLVSSGSRSGIVLSVPGRLVVVDQAGSRTLAVGPGQYAIVGADGTLAVAGAGKATTRPAP